MQRYKICQQFTTPPFAYINAGELFQICKDTKFVSNSQRSCSCYHSSPNCFRYAKIQNLSAIHNRLSVRCGFFRIVSDMQRYKICQQFTTLLLLHLLLLLLFQICKDTKFVSNSQRFGDDSQEWKNCFRYAKIQNLSAIHNGITVGV